MRPESLPPEFSEFVTAANLIPLKKKSGPKDVRPIACGEVLRRVVEQVILRKHLPEVKTHFEPEQVGVGLGVAATQTAIACPQLLPKLLQQPKMRLPQIDLKNAFNSVRGGSKDTQRPVALRMVKTTRPNADMRPYLLNLSSFAGTSKSKDAPQKKLVQGLDNSLIAVDFSVVYTLQTSASLADMRGKRLSKQRIEKPGSVAPSADRRAGILLLPSWKQW